MLIDWFVFFFTVYRYLAVFESRQTCDAKTVSVTKIFQPTRVVHSNSSPLPPPPRALIPEFKSVEVPKYTHSQHACILPTTNDLPTKENSRSSNKIMLRSGTSPT